MAFGNKRADLFVDMGLNALKKVQRRGSVGEQLWMKAAKLPKQLAPEIEAKL